MCITRCQHCWLFHIYQIFSNWQSYRLLVCFLITTTYVENIKRLTGADAALDSVGQWKISGLECLSSSLAEPTMESVYYISSWRVQKWLQTTFLMKFQFIRSGNMAVLHFQLWAVCNMISYVLSGHSFRPFLHRLLRKHGDSTQWTVTCEMHLEGCHKYAHC